MTKKRLVSAILALVMITVVLPCSAIAEAGSPLSALTVGETELTVSQDDLTTGWTGSTGWKYYAGKYLALVDLKEGKDITAQGDLQLAMAGLNHITALESDADVHIFGTGILLLDDVGVEGTVTIDSQSAPAVFVLQEGTYQLQNPETAPAILDEAYTLPGGVNYLLPAGTSMKMVTTHFMEEGDHKYSAANLTIPSGVEMVVAGKLAIADNFCGVMYAVSAANLHVKGKLSIQSGASVTIGGDITVENGGVLQCEEFITDGYQDAIWDDGQGVWYPGMVRILSGKAQTIMLDGATVLVGCSANFSSITTKGNSVFGVTGPYKVDISSLKAEAGKLQVKGFNFYQSGVYGSIPAGYSAVSLGQVSGDVSLEAGQFTLSGKTYPNVTLKDDVAIMNVVDGTVGSKGITGHLFTAHKGALEKGHVRVYVDTTLSMRHALGYCETDSSEAQNKFFREMDLLGADIQSYLAEDETTLLRQAGYDTLKDLVSVSDFDPQAYGQMYTVTFQVVSYPGTEEGKTTDPVVTYITNDNGKTVDLNEVAVVRCVAQMQSIGSTLGSTTSTTNTSATGSGNLGGSDGGSLSTSGASTSLQLTSYTVSASAGTGGRVSPGGKTRVPKGGSLRISITPDSEYEIDKVTVDGTSIGAETSYTFSNVSGNHTISASFKQKVTATPTPTPVPTPTPSPVPTPTPAPTSTPTPVPTVTPTPTPTAKPTAAQSHSITTTAGTGGTVSPAGTASYATGSSLTVKIKAKDGYVISKVTVDGKSVGAVSSYTFKDINADHTLKATFEDDGYDPEPTGHTIYASAGNGGSISPSGSISCTTGTSRTFTISADNGYELVDVKIDGVSMGVMKSYTFKSINDSHTINASFKKTSAEEIPTQTVAPQQGMTYAITITSGNGGSVSPDGNVLASQGGQQVFSIVPESGYEIDDVQVDGVSVGAVSQYVMQDITRNHTVTATFKKSETARFAILLGEGTGGTISCQENVSAIPGGTTVVVTITPQEGFAIADVLVDDVSVGAVPQYTFSGVNANHTVNAVFMEKTVEPVSRGGFPWVIVGGGLVILALAAVGVFALQYDRNRKH